MQVGFMITNGGPHPADKWAEMTADTILNLIQIAEDSDTPEAAAARKAKRDLRPTLFNILYDHHDGVQRHERSGNAKVKTLKDAEAHACTVRNPIDCTPHLGAVDDVISALAATPFAAHFAKPEVAEVIKQIVGQHTADVMHIERRWHHDRHVNAAKGA